MTNSAFNAREIAKVNNVAIMAGNDPKKLVPIKPICEALGIDYARQFQKLKDDEDLGPTIGLAPTVAADEKIREMVCLPMEFIFGWLFTINPKKCKTGSARSSLNVSDAMLPCLIRILRLLRQFRQPKAETASGRLGTYPNSEKGIS